MGRAPRGVGDPRRGGSTSRGSRWPRWFGREAPLIVEIGSGVGEATAALAAARPAYDVLALEVWRPGVADTLWRVAEAGAEERAPHERWTRSGRSSTSSSPAGWRELWTSSRPVAQDQAPQAPARGRRRRGPGGLPARARWAPGGWPPTGPTTPTRCARCSTPSRGCEGGPGCRGGPTGRSRSSSARASRRAAEISDLTLRAACTDSSASVSEASRRNPQTRIACSGQQRVDRRGEDLRVPVHVGLGVCGLNSAMLWNGVSSTPG